MLKLILRRIHAGYYQGMVAFWFYLLWPLLYFFSRRPERYPTLNKLRKFISFISSAMAGIFFRYHFEQKIDWSLTYIICPNHTSSIDINSQNILINNNYSFMGKDALLNNPVTALFFKTVDIPVNRDSKMSAFRAFKRSAEALQKGVTMVIFPEGAISEAYPPELIPFKNGPFRLAIELKIPIIPVTSPNTWRVCWDDAKKYGSRPGICDVYVHKPIETAHLTVDDADALKDQVFNMMKQKLEQEK